MARLGLAGLVVAASLASCVPPSTAASNGGVRVLFIGNSLTYSHDIPGIVQALAAVDGNSSVVVESVAEPNYALIDHWNDGSALTAIRRKGWSNVVLQQGPSSLEINRDSLRLLTRMFDEEVRRAGAVTALYSVWPTESRLQDFARAIESYSLAATDVNGLLLPVAAAWQHSMQQSPGIRLYSADGLHPSGEGAYLAALVVYARLFERTPIGLPARLTLRGGGVMELPSATAAALQRSAAAATR